MHADMIRYDDEWFIVIQGQQWHHRRGRFGSV